MYHNPVLLKKSVDDLVTNPDGIYVDVTFGGGGHSREILKRLSPKGRLFSFDQDLDALKNTIEDDRFTLINQNFRFLENSLMAYGISKVDGILADLGVSSHQFDAAERGFSTRSNAPLDMRMNVMQGLDAKKSSTNTKKNSSQVFFTITANYANPENWPAKLFITEKLNLLKPRRISRSCSVTFRHLNRTNFSRRFFRQLESK